MCTATPRVLIFIVLVGLMMVAHAGDAGPMRLDLDTLQARLDGTTLQASEVGGAHVGPITDELFLAIVVDEAAGADAPGSVRGYVCNREVGVWMEGEVNGNTVTLASDDGVIRIEGTIGADGVLGIARLGEAEPRPFTTTPAGGDAGLYRADVQVDGVERTAGWVVLEDDRQRGSLDGKGNDMCPCGGGDLR